LFGERPFSADSLAEATLRAAQGQWNRPPRSPVPARVRRALERGLAADPTRRWPSMRALLDALSPPSRRSWWLSFAALGAVVVTGLWLRPDVAVGRPVATKTESLVGCADARPIDAGWSPETRAQVKRAFVATGLPYAAGTAERLPQHVERWYEASALAERRLCIALALPSSSDLDPARVRGCLDSVGHEMSGLMEGWRAPDLSTIENAIPAALGVEPPTRCLDARFLHEREQLDALPEASRRHAKDLLARMSLNLGERPAPQTEGSLNSTEEFEDAFLEAQRLGLDEYAATLAVTSLRRAVISQAEPETLARSVGRAKAAVARLPEPSTLSVYYELTLADVEQERGDLDACVARLAAVVERAETLWGPEHPETGRIWLNLATAQSKAEDSEAAQRSHRRGVEILERTLGPDHPHTVVTHLAGIVATEASADVQREAYEHALGILLAAYGKDAVVVAMTRDNLADLLRETDPARAERLHRAALAGRSQSNLGVLYTEQGRFDEAIAMHRTACAALEAYLGPTHPDTQEAQARLAHTIEAAK
jgi:tetratricopeptide (TPR) repeat protein